MSSKTNKYKFTFVGGSLFIILLFTVVPLLYSLVLSFQVGRGSQLSYDGFANYERLFSDAIVIKALLNTVGFAILLTPIVLFISFFLANCINNVKSEKLKSIYSVILFFPSITSPVAYAFFFKKMFTADGFLNRFNHLFNPDAEFTNYLLTTDGARIAIVIVCIWAWSGYFTLLMLSGMQSINPQVYKIAKIDGLSPFKTTFKVTLPIVKPVVLLSSVILTGGIFQLFAEVMIISQGGLKCTPCQVQNLLSGSSTVTNCGILPLLCRR